MRTSAPSALPSNRLFAEPGTRSISPNEQKITSGRLEIATALSMSSIGVTQTGHPGPCTSVISLGSRSSRPLFTMVWVWPPQISMIVHGRVTFCRIVAASFSAALGSRYSLRNFTKLLFHRAHLLEVFEDALGFVLVNHADSESNVDQDVLADFGFGSVGEVHFFADAAEINFADAEGDVTGTGNFDDAAWDCQTHKLNLRLKPQFNASFCGTTEVVPFPALRLPSNAYLATLRTRHHCLPQCDSA